VSASDGTSTNNKAGNRVKRARITPETETRTFSLKSNQLIRRPSDTIIAEKISNPKFPHFQKYDRSVARL
jgi:hypothetical protein